MIHKLKEFFDAECCKVLAAGLSGGTVAGLGPNELIGCLVGGATFIYICIKIVKALWFWDKPDKD